MKTEEQIARRLQPLVDMVAEHAVRGDRRSEMMIGFSMALVWVLEDEAAAGLTEAVPALLAGWDAAYARLKASRQ